MPGVRRRFNGRPRDARSGPRTGSQITSLAIGDAERDLIEAIATVEEVSMSEVWRRALRFYAEANGFTTEGGTATAKP